RNQPNPISGANENVSVGIGAAVRIGTDFKLRLKGGIDEAIRRLPVQAALSAAQRQIKSLPARTANVGEIALVGGGRDKLDVIPIDGMEQICAPHQPLIGQTTPYARLEGSRDHLVQARVACEGVG